MLVNETKNQTYAASQPSGQQTTHPDEIVISVKNLTKKYRIFGHPGDRIKQALTFGWVRFHREFTALQDVSFEIKKGETVGIIGRNGSGKSTLLQLLCGILKPTSGTVQVNGRVSALLELGAGFNPEFTGRENVYFQGAIMGFAREQIDALFNEIASFADICEFIDQPVRTYSSGMFVRLAFAVATSVRPDVLVVDEALSVGDAAFQHKCRLRIRALVESGTTLLIVSHDRNTITGLCDRCLLLDHGTLVMDGLPADVFDYYHALLAEKKAGQVSRRQLESGRLQVVSGSGEAQIEAITILDAIKQRELDVIEVGDEVVFEFIVAVKHDIPRLVLGFTIRDGFGQTVFGSNTNSYAMSLDAPQAPGKYRFQFAFKAMLGVGSYSISTALVSTNDRFTNNYECRELAYFFEVRNSGRPPFGGCVWLDLMPTVELLR